LSLVVTFLSGPGQKINGRLPFFFCRSDVLDEGVQVLNEGCHDFFGADILSVDVDLLDHGLCDGMHDGNGTSLVHQ
jgi:hypothetical protein